MLTFERGSKYTRPDIKEVAGIPRDTKGGPWHTGIVEHDGEFLIFANVGTRGRTGHDYDNRWDKGVLHWYHQSGSHIGWPSVKRLLRAESTVHLFWRGSNVEPFEYAGNVEALKVQKTSPVQVRWAIVADATTDFFVGPDEIPPQEYREGAVRRVRVNGYERDRAARQACIDYYGSACAACDLRLEDRYGEVGAGYIHVHHLVPISEIGAEYLVNPVEDLRPVCPNCHAMIHQRTPPLSIDEVRRLLK